MINIKKILKNLSLGDREIEIYLYLVGNKQLTAYEIAKGTSIHKSTVYDNLDKLVQKGFVSSLILKGRKVYSVNELSKTMSLIKEKETLLLSLIPAIASIKDRQEIFVELLEGEGGQREFNFMLFDLAKKGELAELYVLGGGSPTAIGTSIYIERLIKEGKKKGFLKKIKYKGIWNERFKQKKIIDMYNLIGKNKFIGRLPSKVTTVISGDYLAFIFTMQKPFVVRIKNKLLAEEHKYYFNLIWQMAKD